MGVQTPSVKRIKLELVSVQMLSMSISTGQTYPNINISTELIKNNILKCAAKEWTQHLPQNMSVWIMKSVHVCFSHTHTPPFFYFSLRGHTSTYCVPWILTLATKCPKMTSKRPCETNLNPLNVWGPAKMSSRPKNVPTLLVKHFLWFLNSKHFIKAMSDRWAGIILG